MWEQNQAQLHTRQRPNSYSISLAQIQILYYWCFMPHPVVFRGYSWLCNQRPLMARLRDIHSTRNWNSSLLTNTISKARSASFKQINRKHSSSPIKLPFWIIPELSEELYCPFWETLSISLSACPPTKSHSSSLTLLSVLPHCPAIFWANLS